MVVTLIIVITILIIVITILIESKIIIFTIIRAAFICLPVQDHAQGIRKKYLTWDSNSKI